VTLVADESYKEGPVVNSLISKHVTHFRGLHIIHSRVNEIHRQHEHNTINLHH